MSDGPGRCELTGHDVPMGMSEALPSRSTIVASGSVSANQATGGEGSPFSARGRVRTMGPRPAPTPARKRGIDVAKLWSLLAVMAVIVPLELMISAAPAHAAPFVSVPSNYVYNPALGALHDYCTSSLG